MKVVILCGGRGTRIRDVADDIPKPMIPIGGRPVLWHIMKYYSHWGCQDFLLCLGYKAQAIKDFFLNYETQTRDFTVTLGPTKEITFHNQHREVGWRVTLADTGLDAGTGARIKRVQKYLADQSDFMLTYGDGVGNINVSELLAFHRGHGKIMTVTGVRPPGRFGELMNDPDGRVTEFNEKPQASGGRISGGYFVCRNEFLNYLDDSEELTFEQEPMRTLVKQGQVMMYEHNEFWQPMDTFRDYQLLNDLYGTGRAAWKIWE